MIVCLINIRLHLFSVHSLKEKRGIIKSLMDKTRHKFHLSVAEVGDHDIWQSSQVGIALVGNSKVLLEREMTKILDFIEESAQAEIVAVAHEFWAYSGDEH